jgi:hypothetical protein
MKVATQIVQEQLSSARVASELLSVEEARSRIVAAMPALGVEKDSGMVLTLAGTAADTEASLPAEAAATTLRGISAIYRRKMV